MKKTKVKPGAAPAPPGEGEFSLIPNSKLLDLYAAMLKGRMVAKAVSAVKNGRSKQSRLHSEAITAGVSIDLLPSDAICPMISDLAPCAVKSGAPAGSTLKTLLRWWSRSSVRVPAVFSRANVIPPSGSIAARLEATLRLAGHFRSTNSGSVVVFFAEPASRRTKPADASNISDEVLRSSLAQAAAERLPILFVMQSKSDADDLLALSQLAGVPGMVVDRDDVVAAYRVACEALTHARRGNGPTLIHSKPWRMKGDVHRLREERDCLGKMELYLAGKGLDYRRVKDRISGEFAVALRRR